MSRWLMLLLLFATPAFGQSQQNCPIKRVKVEGCNPNNQSACYVNRPVCGEEKKAKSKK